MRGFIDGSFVEVPRQRNIKAGTGGTCVRVYGGEHARDAQPGGRFSPKCHPDNLHVSGLQHVEI